MKTKQEEGIRIEGKRNVVGDFQNAVCSFLRTSSEKQLR